MVKKHRFVLCIIAIAILIGSISLSVGLSASKLNTEHPEYISTWERTKDIMSDPVNETWKHRLLFWKMPIAADRISQQANQA